MHVAVVGAGIHGLSAARRLADGGHRVTVFDPRAVGHGLGSSHGASRIVRRAYPDAYHTGLMTEAYPLWRELEAASGVLLFEQTGMVTFGPKDGPYVAGLIQALNAQGVEFSVPHSSEAVMPGLRLGANEGLVFVPEAGWVRADEALRATYRLAVDAGAEFVPSDAEGLEGFDRVVVCAGPWVRRFWPEAPVRVTLQATASVVADLASMPWIEDGPDLLYGLPTHGPGAKVGYHRPGPETDPDDPNREPPEAMLQAIRSFARRRFGLDEVELALAAGCLYTNTEDEGFLFECLDARTLVVSACSGHGFKFGPWVGKRVAEWVATA